MFVVVWVGVVLWVGSWVFGGGLWWVYKFG